MSTKTYFLNSFRSIFFLSNNCEGGGGENFKGKVKLFPSTKKTSLCIMNLASLFCRFLSVIYSQANLLTVWLTLPLHPPSSKCCGQITSLSNALSWFLVLFLS